MSVVAIVLGWLLIGTGLGLREARRGHWHWLWLAGALAGPFALPLLRRLDDNERRASPEAVSAGSGRPRGGVRVLAGVDGSADSVEAARRAADLLGSRLGQLTLAMVVEYEYREHPGDTSDHRDSHSVRPRATLRRAAEHLGAWLGFEPPTVLLTGAPADALAAYALDEGFDLVTVGSRGDGLSKLLLGSCASRLVRESTVAVLVVPEVPVGDQLGTFDPAEPSRSDR